MCILCNQNKLPIESEVQICEDISILPNSLSYLFFLNCCSQCLFSQPPSPFWSAFTCVPHLLPGLPPGLHRASIAALGRPPQGLLNYSPVHCSIATFGLISRDLPFPSTAPYFADFGSISTSLGHLGLPTQGFPVSP